MEDVKKYMLYVFIALTSIFLFLNARLWYKSNIYNMKRKYIVATYSDLVKLDENFEVKDLDITD